MFQESYPCSTLEHQTWSDNQSQHDLLYGGVSLSIILNLKLAPVPYSTPKWPILQILLKLYTYIEDHTHLLRVETIAYSFLVTILIVS